MTTIDPLLDSYREEIVKMGFSAMNSTNIFSHWDLIYNFFQGVTHEHVHTKDTSMLGHGNKCSLKEESNAFPYDVYLDSLVKGTRTRGLIKMHYQLNFQQPRG